METEYKIKGVIISRTWWAAAVQELNPNDRLAFYDGLLQYAFTNELPGDLPAAVRPMMAMCVPFIDADKVKYNERVERNRANARGGKKASGYQSLPVATNTNTNTSTNTNTNTNTNTISLTPERERFFLCGLFFSRGAIKPAEEMQRFWDYYESLGWRNNKGGVIVKKTSAAKMWNLQTGVTSQALASRVAWYRCMSACECNDTDVFDLLQRTDIEGDVLHIYARDGKKFANLVEQQFIAGLRRFAAEYGCSSTIYHSP